MAWDNNAVFPGGWSQQYLDRYNVPANVAGQIFGQGSTGQKVMQGVGYSFLAPHMIGSLFGKKPQGAPMLGNVTPDLGTDMYRQSMLAGMYGQALNKDLAYGGRMAGRLVPEGKFGRLDTMPYNDIVNRQAGRLEGYSAPEYQALRDITRRDDLRGYAASRENLARNQAYSGVRGPAASYQSAKLGRDFNKQNIESNQKLMLENVSQKDRALKDYSGYIGQRTGVEGQNLDKGRDELAARLGVQFGYGQMGSANRAAAAQYFANADALNMQQNMFNMQQQAQANAPKGGKKGGGK